jgi:phosphatidylserine/phosphatidylglycerophosphate/cardiolipin synthase-like enzyme
MNKEIVNKIKKLPTIISELKKAKNEILVVSTWFTDENLCDVLIKKREEGVSVKLIIEDYVKNDRCRLADLTKAGGEVYKIEKENFGMMYKSYCIVDERVAIFPLSIWSHYILAPNHESLIVTRHLKTIKNLKTHFYDIKGIATKIGTSKVDKSIFTQIKNWVLEIFGMKLKDIEPTSEIAVEKEIKVKQKIKFKVVKTASIIKNDSVNTFINRN